MWDGHPLLGDTALRAEFAPWWPLLAGVSPSPGALGLLLCFLQAWELEAAGAFGCAIGKGLEQPRWCLQAAQRAQLSSAAPAQPALAVAAAPPATPSSSLQLPCEPPASRI